MKRHEIDYFSLSAGLLFTVLGIALAVSAAAQWTPDGRWLGPVILIVLGGGGVAASLAASARQRQRPDGGASLPGGGPGGT